MLIDQDQSLFIEYSTGQTSQMSVSILDRKHICEYGLALCSDVRVVNQTYTIIDPMVKLSYKPYNILNCISNERSLSYTVWASDLEHISLFEGLFRKVASSCYYDDHIIRVLLRDLERELGYIRWIDFIIDVFNWFKYASKKLYGVDLRWFDRKND
jgi:hypothetical protein